MPGVFIYLLFMLNIAKHLTFEYVICLRRMLHSV